MKITSYCIVNNSQFDINGEVRSLEEMPIDKKLEKLYRNLAIDYPRFFKMDRLAKLAIIGIEAISKEHKEIQHYKDDEIAMLFMNVDSSLDTDIKHQKMLDEKRNPSPAIFVYTLANILMGEIAIKKEWYGENLFILATDFNLEVWLKEAQLLFDTNKAKAVVGGWINVFQERFDLRLFFVENESESKGLEINNLVSLCNRI